MREDRAPKKSIKAVLFPDASISSTTSLSLYNSRLNYIFYQAFSSKMKNVIAIFALACVASAGTITPLAVCNARKGDSCPQSGQRACENNGGHSVRQPPTWNAPQSCPSSTANIPSLRCCASLLPPESSTGSMPITARTPTSIATALMACASPTKTRRTLAYGVSIKSVFDGILLRTLASTCSWRVSCARGMS